jgi:hypothetical protein
MMDAVRLQRYNYIEEYVEAGCCGCGGGWRAASLKKKEGNSGYTIQDAIYETLAKYLEDELLPLGGPDEFVKTQLCVKASEKKPAPFQPPSRMVLFVRKAAQIPALKKHLLTVLWSLLPLNLELTTVRNGKRPQHFGQSTGMFGGPQEVILNSNPQAQDFWKNLQALKVRILLLIDKAHVIILPLKNFRLSRFANSADDLMHKLTSFPRVTLSPVSLYHLFNLVTDRHTHTHTHTYRFSLFSLS